MAKVAFVQNISMPYMAVMCLSAALKQQRHDTQVFVGTRVDHVARQVVEYKPDIVAFSCSTGSEAWYLALARELKKRIPATIIMGGPHPTFFPDVIREGPIDIICRGEGDEAIVAIADMVAGGNLQSDIANCWFARGGEVIKNEVRPLIKDLDALPVPDRAIYDTKYPFLQNDSFIMFTGRGCPFDCSYCFNKALKELYCNKGVYVRKRSVDNVIEELRRALASRKIRIVYFQDDTFFYTIGWLREFAEKYAKAINLPYICLLRVEQISEESVKLLKGSNCQRVFFGIESGSEELRFRILNRRISDEEIVRGGALLKKYGIPFRAYNMLGLPGETIDDALKTVRINTVLKTDYPWCSLLYPYPGTELGCYVTDHGLLASGAREARQVTFFKASCITSPHANELANLQKLFFYAVKFPRLTGAIRKAIATRPNIIFDLLFLISYGWCYYRSEKKRLVDVVRTGMRNVAGFYFGRST